MENVRQVAESSTPVAIKKIRIKAPGAPKKQKAAAVMEGGDVEVTTTTTTTRTPSVRRENPYKFVDIMGDGISHLRESSLLDIEFIETRIDNSGSFITTLHLLSGRAYEMNSDTLAKDPKTGEKRECPVVAKEAEKRVKTKVNNYYNRQQKGNGDGNESVVEEVNDMEE